MPGSDRPPCWALALVLAAALWTWWPAGLTFRSDDYIALHWVQDWDHVLGDFVGPQYGLERLALFHRPLVTLSIAVDALLGGNGPLWPLCANLLVHLANAVLVWLLLRRLASPLAALAATAFWLLHPNHLEAVSWVVGRVDTHATLFALLAVELDLRRREGRLRSLVPALAAFVLGCWTKESCLVVPGVLALLWLVREPGSVAARIVVALERLRPYAAALLGVLLLRLAFLGEVVGGYEAQVLDPRPALRFWTALLPSGAGTPATVLAALALVAAAVLARRRWRLVLALVVAAVLLALPAAGAGGGVEPRYGYLMTVALAGALAVAGPVPALLLLGAWAGVGLDGRAELRRTCAEVVRLRDAALARVDATDRDPVLVEAPSRVGRFRAFPVGVDRLGVPPFHDGHRRVLPDRPFFEAVPEQRTPPPVGRLATVYAGPDRLDHDMLVQLAEAWANGDSFTALRLEGLRPHDYAVWVLGMQGWFRVRVPALPNGSIELGTVLRTPLEGLPRGRPPLVFDLWPSVDAGLDPEPALWLEAFDADGRSLGASERPLLLPLTRDLPTWFSKKRPGLLWLLIPLAFSLPLRLRTRRRRGGPSGSERAREAGATPGPS
ncbi:MAG: hypothetical protein R3F30_12450 [Planctomycetota bacterium]